MKIKNLKVKRNLFKIFIEKITFKVAQVKILAMPFTNRNFDIFRVRHLQNVA